MIKTVSFAASRASSRTSSPSSSSLAARARGGQNAKLRAQNSAPPAPSTSAPALSAVFPKPTAPIPVAAASVREPLQSASPKPRAPRRAPAPSEPSLDLFAAETVPTPKTVAALPAAEKVPPAPTKKRRVKVPENLAEQYGQSLSKRAESGVELPVPEDEAPKKRLNRAERAARRELMNPDDDLRARLARAHSAIPSAKPEKRPRGWRFDCGRCGQTSFFQTPGAICGCGALAIKD